jgi:hypothetical protein
LTSSNGSGGEGASKRAEALAKKIGSTYAKLPVEVIEYYMDRPPADKNARKRARNSVDRRAKEAVERARRALEEALRVGCFQAVLGTVPKGRDDLRGGLTR